MCKVTNNYFYFGMDDNLTRVLQYNQNQDKFKTLTLQNILGIFGL